MTRRLQTPLIQALLLKMLVKVLDMVIRGCEKEVPMKVGELTDPMAGVISLDRIPIKIPVGTSIRDQDSVIAHDFMDNFHFLFFLKTDY